MKNLSNLYDNKYVTKIVMKQWRYETVDQQVQILYDHFKPTSVMDVGAANGVHTNSWRKHGCFTCGIEGTVHFEQHLKENTDVYKIQDIREPFDIEKKFDLVTSVEVLEHIEKPYVDIAVDNICKHGDNLFITANPTHKGKSHVNPQPKTYWIEKFTSRGYTYMEDETVLLAKKFMEFYHPASGWLSLHSMVFRKI